MHLNSYRTEINITRIVMLRNNVSLCTMWYYEKHCILSFYNWSCKNVIRFVMDEICYCIFPFTNRYYFDEFTE